MKRQERDLKILNLAYDAQLQRVLHQQKLYEKTKGPLAKARLDKETSLFESIRRSIIRRENNLNKKKR